MFGVMPINYVLSFNLWFCAKTKEKNIRAWFSGRSEA